MYTHLLVLSQNTWWKMIWLKPPPIQLLPSQKDLIFSFKSLKDTNNYCPKEI